MAIQGLRTTANFVTNQRPQNWREGILLLYPNGDTPLTAVTSLMKKRTVDDPQFNWWDKILSTRRLALASSATALTVGNSTVALNATDPITGAATNGQQLKVGDLLLVEQTGEVLRVSSDPNSQTSIVVTRGFSGTTPTAVNTTTNGVNPWLKVMGTAYEEGSLPPPGISFDPTQRFNYTQIFRDTLEATRTATKTRLRTGDAVKEAKRECLEYHSINLEWAFWEGQQFSGTANGKPIRTLGGMNWFITNYNGGQNVKVATTDYPSGFTMRGFEEYMYQVFQYGAKEKMAFCGNRSLLTINRMVRKNSQQHFILGEPIKEYGMDVQRLTTPFGTIVLKNHPLFNQVVAGSNTAGTYGLYSAGANNLFYGRESWMYILDMANITYVNLEGSDTQYQPDLQANGLDGLQSGYLTECSMEVHHPASHFLIKNLIDAVADAT